MYLVQGQPNTGELTMKIKDLPLRSQTGIDFTFVRPAYQLSARSDQQDQLINNIKFSSTTTSKKRIFVYVLQKDYIAPIKIKALNLEKFQINKLHQFHINKHNLTKNTQNGIKIITK